MNLDMEGGFMKGTAIVFFVSLFAFFITDCAGGHYGKPFTATVVEKVYKPSSTSTGYAFTSKGDMALVTTSESETYTLILKTGSEAFSQSVRAGIWATKNKGDTVTLLPYYGKFTEWHYVNVVSN